MINFLEHKYGTKASCNQVSQDGYEVSNLIVGEGTRSMFVGNAGFLAEHFIKPPVDINFFFSIPIHISSIELGLCVGAQTTDGIEIQVSDVQDDCGVLQVVYRQCPIPGALLKVSNASFRARPPFLQNKDGSTRLDSKYLFKLTHLLNNVRTVRVRIFKTLGSSVPALGSAKVFGIPGRACKPEEWNRTLRLLENFSTVHSSDHHPTSFLEQPAKNAKVSLNAAVPEEFLDSLTYEIMSLPVLLPSGQSVDKSTLERFNNSQASWGRIPCDPFTGIPFGPGRQPTNNTALKARIDSFLVKNAHLDPQLAGVPRSLGEKPKELAAVKTPATCQVECSVPSSSNVISSVNQLVSEFKPEACQTQGLLLPQDRSNQPKSSDDHETVLKDSLSLAINSCYGKSISRIGSESDRARCAGCSTDNCVFWYKLPCGHYLCRSCLLASENFCFRCRNHFLREQVHRTYSIP